MGPMKRPTKIVVAVIILGAITVGIWLTLGPTQALFGLLSALVIYWAGEAGAKWARKSLEIGR